MVGNIVMLCYVCYICFTEEGAESVAFIRLSEGALLPSGGTGAYAEHVREMKLG